MGKKKFITMYFLRMITVIPIWCILFQNIYSQEKQSILNEQVSQNFDTLTVKVDSLEIIRKDGSIEREVYLYDLSIDQFTQLYKIKDSSGFRNNWRHVYNYGTDNKIESRCGDNWIDSIWVPSWCYNYEYDEKRNRVSETLLNFKIYSDSWVNIKRSLNTYNTFNQMIIRKEQKWNGSDWGNSWQAEYGYDEYGNMNYLISGDYVSNLWIQKHRTNIIFNEERKRLFYQSEIKSDNQNWIYDIRIINKFNIIGNMISESRDEWENEKWINKNSILYTYDDAELLLKEEVGYYEDSTWYDKYRYLYEYNFMGKKSLELIEVWDTTTWKNNSRTTFEYDNNANLIKLHHENHYNGYWESSSREIYDYKQNQLDNIVFEHYSNGSWNLRDGNYDFYGSPGIFFYIKGAKISFYYQSVTQINNNHLFNNNYNLSQNYPNPFNPTTKINYSLPESGMTRIYLFDILGREILKLIDEFKEVGNYELEFNASELSNGVYFYKITSGQYSKTNKMVLLK